MANRIISGDYYPARIVWHGSSLALWRFPMEWMALNSHTLAAVDLIEKPREHEEDSGMGGFIGGFIGFIPIFIPLGHLPGRGDTHGYICDLRFRDGCRAAAEVDEAHYRALRQAVYQS